MQQLPTQVSRTTEAAMAPKRRKPRWWNNKASQKDEQVSSTYSKNQRADSQSTKTSNSSNLRRKQIKIPVTSLRQTLSQSNRGSLRSMGGGTVCDSTLHSVSCSVYAGDRPDSIVRFATTSENGPIVTTTHKYLSPKAERHAMHWSPSFIYDRRLACKRSGFKLRYEKSTFVQSLDLIYRDPVLSKSSSSPKEQPCASSTTTSLTQQEFSALQSVCSHNERGLEKWAFPTMEAHRAFVQKTILQALQQPTSGKNLPAICELLNRKAVHFARLVGQADEAEARNEWSALRRSLDCQLV